MPGESAISDAIKPQRTRRARVLLASHATASLGSATDFASCPSHVLQAAGRAYYWRGAGPLSVKMFRGGTARYRSGGARYAVGDASYLLLNHGQEYEIAIESDAPVESFCLFFRAGLAEEVARSLAARPESLLDGPHDAPGGPLHFYERTYPHDTGDVLSSALFGLRAAVARLGAGPDDAPSPGWVDEQMRAVLERLLARHASVRAEVAAFGASAALLRPATRDELYRRLHRARDFVADAFPEPLTLDEMARVACLSPNHFLRTFKALFGQSPHQYLTERRLAEARRLLLATDLTVTEVCLCVGFVSLGSFSSLFARRFGLSPERYRREHRVPPAARVAPG